uniref:hypothetical protein n=1 Tax=Flavobacterium sp. TaxID=239 RepID=UPI00404B4A82
MTKNTQFLLYFLFIAFLATAQNQNKLFATFGDGSYTTYKSESYLASFNKWELKLEKASKPWPIAIVAGTTKDFDGNVQLESVTVSRQGVIKEKFTPDIPENPVYFEYKNFRLSVIGDKIYYYEWANDNATIVYLLTKSSVSSYKSEVENINNHVRNSFKSQAGAKGKVTEAREAVAKKEALENSLKGKTVKSIEVVMVDVPAALGSKVSVKFGLKATTTDGKTYSTTNIGGKTLMEDFSVTTTDGLFVDGAIEIHEDISKVANDELKFTVASKYTPAVKVQKVIPLNYAFSTFDIKQNGMTADEVRAISPIKDSKNGVAAKPLEVKIQNATTKSGVAIYKVEVVDITSGKIVSRTKIGHNTKLNIYANGGYADDGSDDKKPFGGSYRKAGDGKNGGDGANIIVSKSSDAGAIQLNIFNKGGNGGKGGEGAGIGYHGNPGRDGKPGTITNKTLSGSFAW